MYENRFGGSSDCVTFAKLALLVSQSKPVILQQYCRMDIWANILAKFAKIGPKIMIFVMPQFVDPFSLILANFVSKVIIPIQVSNESK